LGGGARRRRRLRLKIFIYPEEMVGCGLQEGRLSREVDRRMFGSLPTDAHGRDHDQSRDGVRQGQQDSGLRVKTYANFGAYMSFSSSVPTYLYATLLSGQYNIPNIYAEVISVYTNTNSVDAYRMMGRPEASSWSSG
jgi:carbon-monoxide dehydrogenase large subunit